MMTEPLFSKNDGQTTKAEENARHHWFRTFLSLKEKQHQRPKQTGQKQASPSCGSTELLRCAYLLYAGSCSTSQSEAHTAIELAGGAFNRFSGYRHSMHIHLDAAVNAVLGRKKRKQVESRLHLLRSSLTVDHVLDMEMVCSHCHITSDMIHSSL